MYPHGGPQAGQVPAAGPVAAAVVAAPQRAVLLQDVKVACSGESDKVGVWQGQTQGWGHTQGRVMEEEGAGCQVAGTTTTKNAAFT